MRKWFYAVCHINPIKMSSTRCVCITVRRGVLQNIDSAQPLRGYFLRRARKKNVYQPRYRQPESQVSLISTSMSAGSSGLSRAQTQIAKFSLVGFSSPGTSLR